MFGINLRRWPHGIVCRNPKIFRTRAGPRPAATARPAGLVQSPAATKFIKRVLDAQEFINSAQRYCLWIDDAAMTAGQGKVQPKSAGRKKKA